MDIANTILEQLGGRRFAAMTGSKNFLAGKNYLTFNVGRNHKKITHVRITLNGLDLYDVEFMKVRGINSIRNIATVNNVYFDILEDVFTEHTGLYTRL